MFEGSPAPLPPALGQQGWWCGELAPRPLSLWMPTPQRNEGPAAPCWPPSLALLRALVLSAEKAVLPLSALGSPDAPLLHTLLQMPPPRAPCSAPRGLRFYLHPPGDNDLFITWWGGRMLLKLLRASARARQATRQLYRHKTVGHLRVSVNPDSLGF